MSRDIDDMLADALRKVGLDDLATLASEGYYSDFGSPLAVPKMALAHHLAQEGLNAYENPDRKAAILALRKRVMGGDFDG
jgi:hypothetical protein